MLRISSRRRSKSLSWTFPQSSVYKSVSVCFCIQTQESYCFHVFQHFVYDVCVSSSSVKQTLLFNVFTLHTSCVCVYFVRGAILLDMFQLCCLYGSLFMSASVCECVSHDGAACFSADSGPVDSPTAPCQPPEQLQVLVRSC